MVPSVVPQHPPASYTSLVITKSKSFIHQHSANMKLILSLTLTLLLSVFTALAEGKDKERRPRPKTITKTVTIVKDCAPTTVTIVKDCAPTTVTITETATPTECSTGCESPTAVATFVGQIQPPPLPSGAPDYVEGLTFGPGWAHIACEIYCSSNCGVGLPSCDPSCSNKGTCGNSNRTNLFLGGLADPANTQYTITATPPARSFSIPLIFLTAGETDFMPQYPYINFEVRSWDRFGNAQPTQNFIVPKPPYGAYHTDIRLDLLNLGLVDVSKLEFYPFQEGSIGSGGQGPDGRVMASLKIDGDGFGGPIPYQVFTPQC